MGVTRPEAKDPLVAALNERAGQLVKENKELRDKMQVGKGDPRFHELMQVEVIGLHDKKQEDYGRNEDPFANVRQSREWGVPPWVGALIRANDKVKRLQKAARGGQLANETVEDSLLDLIVYAGISLILYREERLEDPVE